MFGIIKDSSVKHPALATFGLLYGAVTWGIIWYPYRLLEQAGISGAYASLLTYLGALLIGAFLFAPYLRELLRSPRTMLGLALAAGWANLGYVLAVIDGEVMRVTLLFYLSPLWTLLLARVLLDEHPGPRGNWVLLLSLGGAFTMLWDPAKGWPLPRDVPEWVALSAGMGFSLTNVLTRRATQLSLSQKSFAVWGGVATLALLYILLGPRHEAAFPELSLEQAGLIVLLAVALVLATLLVQYGVTHTLATRAAVIFLFELVVAAVFSYLLAGEALNLREAIGGIMIVAATLCAPEGEG
jgi:drug/metabolite transporter (DMT)-like permease